MKIPIILASSLLLLGGCCHNLLESTNPSDRRIALIQLAEKQNDKAIPTLEKYLEDPNPFVRRTALRLISEQGKAGLDTLKKAIRNKDEIVKRNALQSLTQLLTQDELLPVLEIAIKDSSDNVRIMAATLLAAVTPATGKRLELLQLASKDNNLAVRQIASKYTWPFYRNKTLIRDRKDWDHDVKVLQKIQLPKDNWRFTKDLKVNGHTLNFFAPKFDDSAWRTISIEAPWENTIGAFDGVGWYRKNFKAPDKPAKFNAVEMNFKGVDECAWVWLNGIYVGQHDLGPDGWDIQFAIDVTDEIKWGQDNQITVRVLDSAFAGGIWRPIFLEILD